MHDRVAELVGSQRPSVEDIIRQELFTNTPEEEAQRARITQEFQYNITRPLLEQAGNDPKLLEQARRAAVLAPEQQQAAAADADAMTEALLMPVAKKLLQLHGLDPETAEPDAVRAALAAPITPEQQVQLDKVYNAAANLLYAPVLKQMLEDVGVEVDDNKGAQQLWRTAEQKVKEWDLEPANTNKAAIAVPAALLGCLVTVAVTQLISWVRRRRRQGRQQQQQQLYEEPSLTEE